jgi:hypothetical protein
MRPVVSASLHVPEFAGIRGRPRQWISRRCPFVTANTRRDVNRCIPGTCGPVSPLFDACPPKHHQKPSEPTHGAILRRERNATGEVPQRVRPKHCPFDAIDRRAAFNSKKFFDISV